ncbi:MAG TPA: polymer-forming cytoskeletal family protein [Gammaproteobacteria bacterium]|nr:polymer-forming cytoskeletal family protein [Gammaproteobacteria bacterium]
MFFGKKNTRQNSQIDSLIGSGTEIHGDVHFKDGLHIDGVVKGNVVAEGDTSMLTMSEEGRIEGEVRVHNLVLNGEVRGDVHASEHIELAPAARVTGNVYYNLIEMAMGAEVNGNLVHKADTSASTATSLPETDAGLAADGG